MQYLRICLLALFCTGCTLNIIQTDTHGHAEDVVDDTSSASPNIEASIPIKGI